MSESHQSDLKGKFAQACDFLHRCSRISVLAALITVCILLLFLLIGSTASGQVMPLDLRFWYDPGIVYATFESLDEAGRWLYLVGILTLDVLYPLVYSFMFAVWLTLVLPRDMRFGCALQLLPFTVLMADLLENASIAVMLSQFPARMEFLAFAAALFTAGKWSLAAVVIAAALVFTLRKFIYAISALGHTD